MPTPPKLTDRKALEQHRFRATADRSFFLIDEIVFEVEERLRDVNRTFTRTALVSGLDIFAQVFPETEQIADTPKLSIEPSSSDLVLHLLALHWADDPVGQLVQARLALKPDGHFLGVAFGGATLNELRSSLAAAESDLTGGLSPRVAPMADIRDLGGLMQRAGFALPVSDVRRLRVTYPDLRSLARDLRAIGETNALAARRRTPATRDLFRRAEDVYRAHFAEDGKLVATFELVFLSGWAPGPDQPQPLRPGSARMRLADSLGTPEITLPEDDAPR